MSTWKKIIGTQETEFRVGLQGPKIVKGTNGLEVRNAAGALTEVSADTFVGENANFTNMSVTGVVDLTDLNVSGNAILNGVTYTGQQITATGSFEILSDQDIQIHHVGSGTESLVFADATGAGFAVGSNDLFLGTDGNVTASGSMSVDNSTVRGELVVEGGLSVVGDANLGNVVATSFSGDAAGLSNITGANVTGQVANAAVADVALSVAAGNIIGTVANAAFATTAGTVAGANVSGNVAGANIAYALSSDTANVSILGGSAGQFLQTDGAGNLVFATVDSSSIQNGSSSVVVPVANGNVITTVAGTQITTVSAGGLTLSGNLDITGNVNVTGNLNYQNVTDLVVGDPLIFLGANNSADLFDLGFSASYNNGATVHTGFARDATDGVWKLFDGVAAAPTTTVDFDSGTYAKLKTGDVESTGNVVVVGAVVTRSITGPLGNLVTEIQMEDDSEQIDFTILDSRKMRIDEDGIRVSGEVDADSADFENLRATDTVMLPDATAITIFGGTTGQVLAASGVDDKLEWVTLSSHSDAMRTIMVGVDFNGGTPYSVNIPAGSVVDSVSVIVDTAFDGGATVTVGNASVPDYYVGAADTSLTDADRFEIPQSYGSTGAESAIVVALTPSGDTVGFVRVIVSYSTPRS